MKIVEIVTLILTVVNTIFLVGLGFLVADIGNRLLGKSDPTRR